MFKTLANNILGFSISGSRFKFKPTSRKTASVFLLTFFLFCCFSFAAAQSDDSARVEVFGGYSVLRTNYEAELPNPPMPVIVAFDGKQTFNGFNASAAVYLNKSFGLVGDFSGHFKTESLASALGGNIETRIRIFNVLGGPQFKFRSGNRAKPFARALFGVANTRSKLSITRLNSSDTLSSTDFAMAIGGGLDVRVSDRIDLRVFQADYNPIFLRRGNELGFGKSRADNVRFSFGMVFK